MSKIVWPSGPVPCDVFVVAEAPGREEANKGRGLVGAAGREWWKWCPWSEGEVRISNCVKEQPPGNRNPNAKELAYWLPMLEEEVEEVNPTLIVTLGAFSTQWALGDDADLKVLHGRPTMGRHGIQVFPCYHPAAGIHEPMLYTHFYRDMEDLTRFVKGTLRWKIDNRTVHYQEVTDYAGEPYDAVDTEGTLKDPISIQVSSGPRQAVLMTAQFRAWNAQFPLVFHNAIHDLKVLERLGFPSLEPDEFEDTMVMARLLGAR